MSEAWANLEDVIWSDGTSDGYASACRLAASAIRGQAGTRATAVATGRTEFTGAFSRLFDTNAGIARGDAEEVATALDEIAVQVDYLKEEAHKEQQRRETARQWAIDQADKSLGDKLKDGATEAITLGLADTDHKPSGPQPAPPPKEITAASKPREAPQPGGGGGSDAGTSSAMPSKLLSFASTSSSANIELSFRPTSLRSHAQLFRSACQYGTIEAEGVFTAFQLFNELNEQDVLWARTLAEAFAAAGGDAAVSTLSNAALAAALQAQGVSQTRLDITVPPPTLQGVNPTSGYVDDPVNAATGNFIEPEADLGFGGACSALVLSRTYNSFDTGTHAFGPGWSSWTEIALRLDDEAATMTLPDGREVVFPRLGQGWDRARGEAAWLHRDEAADELRVSDNEGGTWRFSSTGVPRSHDRGEGTMVRLVHAEGRLVRLEHERGRQVGLTWEGDRVTAAQTSDGRRMTYSYDDGGRLVAATGPHGTRTYHWDEDDLVTAVVDADGVVELENAYDDLRRVTRQRSPHGRTSRYAYLPGRITVVSDPDGTRSNTWISDDRGRLVGIIDSDDHRQSFAYDSFGNRVLVTERDGSVTVRTYDERGRLVREVLPTGADLHFDHDELDRVVSVVTEEGAETRYSYDGTSRHPSVWVDPEGGETRLTWQHGQLVRLVDPTGVELRFEHDEHGDLVATTNAVGDTARLEHDDAGRVTAAVTPAGHRTSYTYDARGLVERRDPDGARWRYERTGAGRLAAVVDPTGARTTIEHGAGGDESRVVDPLGRATSRHLDDLGNLAALELPDGSQWRFTHDGLSRLTSTTTPDGQTWSRTYDAVGELVETVAPTGDHIGVSTDRDTGTVVATDAAGAVTHRFDGLGRQLSTEQPDGSVAVATYDRCGHVVEQLDGEGGLTRIERDAGGRPVAVTSPVGDVTRFEYDACGRRSAETDPLGARTTIEYDADSRPVRVTLPTGEVGWTRYDECGRVVATYRPGVGLVRHAYDAAGRVVEIQDGVDGVRRFTYDAAGQLLSATNGNGGITRYGYDVLGRVVAITDPLGQVTHREFDEMDRCVAETDPLGRTTRAGYDAAGRQAWQQDARGHRTQWTYDGAGRVSAVTLDGRPLARISRDGAERTVTLADTTHPDGRTVTHVGEWNRRGQLVRRSRDGETLRWRYDAAGRRTAMTLPDGGSVAYAYDAAGNLVAVDHPLLGRATLERDPAGRVTAATAGDLLQSWTYTDGFVSEHTTTDAEGSTRTVVDRDHEGRILRVERDDVATTYDYDAACQIIESRVGGDAVRWRYDASGRIVLESGADGARGFSYDAGGQLLTVEGPEGTTRHDYDQIGRRTRTTYADGRTRELGWSPTGWLATIVDEAGGESVRTEIHVDASGELAAIDGASVWWDSAVDYAPSLALIGATPVLPVGPVTAVGDTWMSSGWRGSRADGDDDVWSVLQAASRAAVPGLPAGVGISPAGQLTLGDLEWLGARVYDAATRGFLATDPRDPVTGAAWSGNPYSYAGNDPLHALDPTGLKPISQAELDQMNASWATKAWDATTDWVDKNTDYLIGGAMAAAGVAAMFIPVVGPALGGALVSAGADVIMQRIAAGKDGQINYKQVAVAGAAGLVGGGGGAVIKATVSAGARRVAANIALNTGVSAAQSVGSYAVDDERGEWDWGTAGMKGLQGAGSGFIGGATAAKFDPLKDAAGTAAARRLGAVMPEVGDDALRLTTEQAVARQAARLGVETLSNAEAEVLKQTLTTGDLDGGTFRDNMLKGAGTGVVKTAKPGVMTVEAPKPSPTP